MQNWIVLLILVLSYHPTNSVYEALQALIVPASMKCVETEGLPSEFLLGTGAVSKKAACFIACFLKEIKLLAQDGNYVPAEAFQAVRPYLEADLGPDKLWKYEQTFTTCSYVADIPVSDGNKGCERAMEFVKCLRAKGRVVFICKVLALPKPNNEVKKQLIERFSSYSTQCFVKHQLSLSDIQTLKTFELPESPEALCFIGCVVEKAGLMDPKGNLNTENAMELVKSVSNDPQQLNEASQVLRRCSEVADVEVIKADKTSCTNRELLTCLMQHLKESTSGKLVDGDGSTAVEKPAILQIIDGIFRQLVLLACSATSQDTLPGRLLSYLPGSSLVTFLCGLAKGF